MPGGSEERLPDYFPDLPYIATRVSLERFAGRAVPWHWHSQVELFYMEQGALEYSCLGGSMVFPAGSAGFVNSNVLHASRSVYRDGDTVSKIHLFDPLLISGSSGSRIDKSYVTPITSAPHIQMIRFRPENLLENEILTAIKAAFSISDAEAGYEIRIREAMSDIWLKLFRLMADRLGRQTESGRDSDRLKALLRCVHERYAEKLTVAELSAAAYISERECFRLFHSCLHTTPTEYITSFRLREAADRLIKTPESASNIAYSCGFSSGSYFGKLFRERFGLTPTEYRLEKQKAEQLAE